MRSSGATDAAIDKPRGRDRPAMKPPPIPWTAFFAVLCGLAGAACLTLAQQPLWPSQGHAYALAIERGMQEALATGSPTDSLARAR